jgi:hypothetical protein
VEDGLVIVNAYYILYCIENSLSIYASTHAEDGSGLGWWQGDLLNIGAIQSFFMFLDSKGVP